MPTTHTTPKPTAPIFLYLGMESFSRIPIAKRRIHTEVYLACSKPHTVVLKYHNSHDIIYLAYLSTHHVRGLSVSKVTITPLLSNRYSCTPATYPVLVIVALYISLHSLISCHPASLSRSSVWRVYSSYCSGCIR